MGLIGLRYLFIKHTLMRLLLHLTLMLFLSFSLNAQTIKPIINSSPLRTITDNGTNGIEVSYSFNSVNTINVKENNTNYSRLFIEDFSHLQEVGLPAMPFRFFKSIITQFKMLFK